MKTPIIIGGKKIGRWRASFLLFAESWRFLRADKELLLVPVFSTLFSLLLIGLATLVAFVLSGSADALFSGKDGVVGYTEYLFMFVVYLCGAFSLSIAQATVVHIVYVRAHGGNATLWSGIVRAFANWYPLFIWSLITSTVGMILRFISDRSQIVGRIVAGLLGAAWSILTFFAVPIILIEKKSPLSAVSASAVLFRKTWGETLVSNVTLGLVFLLAHLVVLGSFVGLLIYSASTLNSALLIISIVGVIMWLIVATLVSSALSGILKTLLYIYAAEGVVPGNFNRELLESMLVGKGSDQVSSTIVASPVTQSSLV
jgi:hypothetical protein